ncbi:MAG: nitronate monooxygenase [Euryarchaeota archaeon]|nr:nitronate monooxygenase [Euryarchaeota archaeon]MBU4607735.1 nitronate monooxygenase [Euryarchaeota archaeon]MBV1729609.1 nitronate monooxygenase [Methanobacterium sp.]MBV1755085.1 nitronate monooxygenase [Methanobacterium sp.]
MPFIVTRNKDLCLRSFDREGCCWYKCDDKDDEQCKKCYSCYNNCPNEVYDVINDQPFPTRMESCAGCRICAKMCPNDAISVSAVPADPRAMWTDLDMDEIQRKALQGNYRVRSCGVRREIPTLSELVMVPGQLAVPPVDKYREECNSQVILGSRYAKNPLVLDTPIMIGAMSYGSLSKESKVALAIGASLSGTIANTGEGGLIPEEREAADKLTVQYSSGRFGVSATYLRSAEAIEVKVGQGAKPGMGGHLLAEKITPEVASVRGLPMGTDALSPCRFLDSTQKGDLGKHVELLREVTDSQVPIIIKLGPGRVYDDVRLAVEAGADIVAVDGMEGGTGAAPHVVIEEQGIPTVGSLIQAVDSLNDMGVKDEVDLIMAGGIKDGATAAKAMALGADTVYVATAALIAMGCCGCESCASGNCREGIATQDLKMRRRLEPKTKGERVSNFINAMNEEIKMLAQISGHNDIRNLNKEDLRALNTNIAAISRVKLISEA